MTLSAGEYRGRIGAREYGMLGIHNLGCAPCAQRTASGIGDLEIWSQTYRHSEKPVMVNLGRPRSRRARLSGMEVWRQATPPSFVGAPVDLGTIDRWSRTTAWPVDGRASEPISVPAKIAFGGLAGLALAALL